MKTLLLALLLSFTTQAGTFYVSFTDGNDANNGTAKATPWKKAPQMRGFGGSYSHTAGDRFIFKGSDTWPITCFQMAISVGGSSDTVRDYYGVDVTWFRGGSFARPIFDFQHTALGSGFNSGASLLITTGNLTFDNLEMINQRGWTGNAGWGSCTMNIQGETPNITLTNSVIRDWDLPLPLSAAGNGGDNDGTGGIIWFTGSNANNIRVTHCLLHQAGVTAKCGTAIKNIGGVDFTEVYQTCQSYLGGGVLHDNTFHDLQAGSDPAQHGNCMEMFGPSIIYNNLIYNLNSEVAPILIASDWSGLAFTNQVYNNTMFNVGGQVPVGMDTGGSNPSHTGIKVYNNTIEHYDTVCVAVANRGPYTFGLLDVRNNQFITTGNPLGYNGGNWGFVNTIIVDHNLTNSQAAANTAGYTAANLYQPSSGSNPTVGTGTNLSSVYTFDRLNLARTVPFDIGSYQWQGSVVGNPGNLSLSSSTYSTAESTTLTVTVQRIGGSTGTVGASYATSDGTALAGTDYTSTSGTVSFGGGVTSATFNVTILRNVAYTGSRSFTVTLSSATGGAALSSPTAATVSIIDTDPPPSTIPVLGLSFKATNMNILAPFTISGGRVLQTVTTDPTNSSGHLQAYVVATNAGDYKLQWDVEAVSGDRNSFFLKVGTNITDVSDINPFTSGQETRFASLRDTGTFDANALDPAIFHWTANSTNYVDVMGREGNTVISNLTFVQIITPPTSTQQVFFASSTATVIDNQGGLSIPVLRTQGTNGTITVNYATANGTALSGVDYTATSGTLTLTNGVTQSSVVVPIIARAQYQGTKSFTLNLSSPTNCVLGSPSTDTISITDFNRPPIGPPASLTISGVLRTVAVQGK